MATAQTTPTLNPGTAADVLVGLAGVRVSTVDTHPFPSHHVGYTENGVTLRYSPSVTNIKVAEEKFPIDHILTDEEIQLELTLAEATTANLDITMMGADDANTAMIRFKSTSTAKFQSLLIEGECPGGTATGGIRQVLFQKVGAMGQVQQPYVRDGIQMLPVTFTALKPAQGDIVTISDFYDVAVATGTFAFADNVGTNKMSVRALGETDSADAIATVTAGASGDKLVIRAALDAAGTAINTITLTHTATGGGVLVNATAADHVLDDLRDWVEYTHDGTDWDESDRFIST